MKNDNKNEMVSELFISVKENKEYLFPPKSKEEYLKVLKDKGSIDDKIKALSAIIEISRLERVDNKGKYTDGAAKKMVNLLHKFGLQIGLSEKVAFLLMDEGMFCEKMGDYKSALCFYESSLPFEIKNEKYKYFRLNNLAFCLNYFRRFEEAEKYLREAVQMSPGVYNAWKNLGVCLEHQCQFEEAAECYFKAVELTKGKEPRSVQHLKRLIKRIPSLEKIPLLEEFCDNN